MRTRIESVLIHSCLLEPTIQPEESLKEDTQYVRVGEDPPFNELFPVSIGKHLDYFSLPKRCSCRKLAIYTEAKDIKEVGGAQIVWTFNHKTKEMEIDHKSIWKRQQVKVPRTDLITAADIERMLDGDPDVARKYKNYIEEIHRMYMENRAKLIVPFREDPTEGRLLFPFPPDCRTVGGH